MALLHGAWAVPQEDELKTLQAEYARLQTILDHTRGSDQSVLPSLTNDILKLYGTIDRQYSETEKDLLSAIDEEKKAFNVIQRNAGFLSPSCHQYEMTHVDPNQKIADDDLSLRAKVGALLSRAKLMGHSYTPQLAAQTFCKAGENCTAYLSGNADLCFTPSYCEDDFHIKSHAPGCVGNSCKAYIHGKASECNAADGFCRAILTGNSAACDNHDCAAWTTLGKKACDTGDCKALFSQDPKVAIGFCQHQDCKAIVLNDASQCQTDLCKAALAVPSNNLYWDYLRLGKKPPPYLFDLMKQSWIVND